MRSKDVIISVFDPVLKREWKTTIPRTCMDGLTLAEVTDDRALAIASAIDNRVTHFFTGEPMSRTGFLSTEEVPF